MTTSPEADLPTARRRARSPQDDTGLNRKMRIIAPETAIERRVRGWLHARPRAFDPRLVQCEAGCRDRPVLLPARLFDRMRPSQSERSRSIDDLLRAEQQAEIHAVRSALRRARQKCWATNRAA